MSLPESQTADWKIKVKVFGFVGTVCLLILLIASNLSSPPAVYACNDPCDGDGESTYADVQRNAKRNQSYENRVNWERKPASKTVTEAAKSVVEDKVAKVVTGRVINPVVKTAVDVATVVVKHVAAGESGRGTSPGGDDGCSDGDMTGG